MTDPSRPSFSVDLAHTTAQLEAAQRLRYAVFIEELGGSGTLIDHERRLEKDEFDPFFDHLLLTDQNTDEIVGVYRVMRREQAEAAGGFYSASEYDLHQLLASGRSLLELGRSCLHPDYRGGMAMFYLWNGLADYINAHNIEILFGVASFHSTDPKELAAPLSLLHHRHLAPPELRVHAKISSFRPVDLIPQNAFDQRAAMVQVPSLIKAYLRLGGFVGEGAFTDKAFNTTDVCLILDTKKMNQRQARFYQGQGKSA